VERPGGCGLRSVYVDALELIRLALEIDRPTVAAARLKDAQVAARSVRQNCPLNDRDPLRGLSR